MSGPTQTLATARVRKMLASTVQFSTYDQTPTRLPRRTRALPREARRYEERSAPTEEAHVHPGSPGMVRSLRTQQRAYEPVPRTHPVPRATEVTPY